MPGSTSKQVVRLLNDGPMKWPLWFGVGIADDRERQPISDALETELLAWTRFYHDHYDDTWDSRESVLRYNELGRAVARHVSAELGSEYQVLLLIERSDQNAMRWVEVTSSE